MSFEAIMLIESLYANVELLPHLTRKRRFHPIDLTYS